MPLTASRVSETAASPGSGSTITLGGAETGYTTFANAFPVGSVIECAVEHASSPTVWETGTWTLTNSTTLTRLIVERSSAGGAAPTYSASVRVFATRLAYSLPDLGQAQALAWGNTGIF